MIRPSKGDDLLDTVWKGNIFTRVRQLEMFILIPTVCFVGLFSHIMHSSQRELQAAMSNILEMKSQISFLSGTQSILWSQMEMMNNKMNKYEQLHASATEKEVMEDKMSHYERPLDSSASKDVTMPLSTTPRKTLATTRKKK